MCRLQGTVSPKQSGVWGGELCNPLFSNLKLYVIVKLWKILKYSHQIQGHKGHASWASIQVPTVTQQSGLESSLPEYPHLQYDIIKNTVLNRARQAVIIFFVIAEESLFTGAW